MRIFDRLKRLSTAAIVFAFSANIIGMTPTAAAPSSEIQALTVAFLYNFMKLSEWPPEIVADELIMCTVQAGDYALNVDSLAGKDIQHYKLKIRHLLPGDSLEGCHLLYIPENEKPIRMREWLKTLGNQPILSVSGIPGFLEQGGMVELVSDGNHLQFEVNLTPVEQAGIKLSSKMLLIAREVQGNSQ